MMKANVFLLLLLLCLLQDRVSTGNAKPENPADLSSPKIRWYILAELRSLRGLVNQQGTLLVQLKEDLIKIKQEGAGMSTTV